MRDSGSGSGESNESHSFLDSLRSALTDSHQGVHVKSDAEQKAADTGVATRAQVEANRVVGTNVDQMAASGGRAASETKRYSADEERAQIDPIAAKLAAAEARAAAQGGKAESSGLVSATIHSPVVEGSAGSAMSRLQATLFSDRANITAEPQPKYNPISDNERGLVDKHVSRAPHAPSPINAAAVIGANEEMFEKTGSEMYVKGGREVFDTARRTGGENPMLAKWLMDHREGRDEDKAAYENARQDMIGLLTQHDKTLAGPAGSSAAYSEWTADQLAAECKKLKLV